MREKLIAVLYFGLCALWPSGGQTADLTVVVDRFENSVELFMSLPATHVPGALGGSTLDIAQADGTVPMGRFRDVDAPVAAASVLGATALRIEGVPLPVIAQSVMVHPRNDAPAFDSPGDAIRALSRSTVPEQDVAPRLDDLRLSIGIIARPAQGFGPLTLQFRNPEPVVLRLFHFVGGSAQSNHVLTIGPNGSITLPRQAIPALKKYVLVGGAFATAGLMAGCAVLLTRVRQRRTRA